MHGSVRQVREKSQVAQARYMSSSILTFALLRNSSDLHIYKDLYGFQVSGFHCNSTVIFRVFFFTFISFPIQIFINMQIALYIELGLPAVFFKSLPISSNYFSFHRHFKTLSVYMTDFFLFARLNLPKVLISIANIFFDSDFPSPCFDEPKASNFTSGGVQNRETGDD